MRMGFKAQLEDILNIPFLKDSESFFFNEKNVRF